LTEGGAWRAALWFAAGVGAALAAAVAGYVALIRVALTAWERERAA
jgi:hypothetical protein